MIHLQLSNLRLVARNEGKIKSYDSCTDLRAWSHDVVTRDRYLREWMKADAPACYIPCNFLIGGLSRMTCKSRRRVIPHCRPDCKSRVLLECICNSCQAFKECLRQVEDLEFFFVEEELESSHWPCDRCLEALKSIKMFWKILIFKLFGMSVTKSDDLNTEWVTSVKSVARLWQSDMLHQASYVKKHTPEFCTRLYQNKTRSVPESPPSPAKSFKSSCIGDSSEIRTNIIKRASKCTSMKFQKTDNACNTCNATEKEQISNYERKISSLQSKCNVQWEDINRLRKENIRLRREMDNVRKDCSWKSHYCFPEDKNLCRRSVMCLVPKPFEIHLEEASQVNNVDSEVIITMKNGKNETFRHVSLLQVLHKSNGPILKDLHTDKRCSSNEDPIEILNKVHCTVGAIVKREMCIAHERKWQSNNTRVDASYHQVQNCQSAPSISLCTPQNSVADFVSTNECDKNSSSKVTSI